MIEDMESVFSAKFDAITEGVRDGENEVEKNTSKTKHRMEGQLGFEQAMKKMRIKQGLFDTSTR